MKIILTSTGIYEFRVNGVTLFTSANLDSLKVLVADTVFHLNAEVEPASPVPTTEPYLLGVAIKNSDGAYLTATAAGFGWTAATSYVEFNMGKYEWIIPNLPSGTYTVVWVYSDGSEVIDKQVTF